MKSKEEISDKFRQLSTELENFADKLKKQPVTEELRREGIALITGISSLGWVLGIEKELTTTVIL